MDEFKLNLSDEEDPATLKCIISQLLALIEYPSVSFNIDPTSYDEYYYVAELITCNGIKYRAAQKIYGKITSETHKESIKDELLKHLGYKYLKQAYEKRQTTRGLPDANNIVLARAAKKYLEVPDDRPKIF